MLRPAAGPRGACAGEHASEMNWITRLKLSVLPAPDSPEITTDWERPWTTPRCTRAAVRYTCGGRSGALLRYRRCVASEYMPSIVVHGLTATIIALTAV